MAKPISLSPVRAGLTGIVVCGGAIVALLASAPSPAQARPTCGGRPAKFVGTNGRDVIRLKKRGRQAVVARGGNDVIVARRGKDRICAGKGDDVIISGSQPDLVWGGPGADTVYGGAGPDVIRGGHGPDTIFGDAGSDHLRGGGGADRLFGGIVDDILRGASGDDLLVGGHGGDGLAGEGGDDWMRGGTNRDGFFGGPGSDTVSFATATPTNSPGGRGGMNVDLARGLATGEGPKEHLRRIENVLGSPFADTLVGRKGQNFIDGGYGDDFLRGGRGRDTSHGGPGSDACTGFEHPDTGCNDHDPRPPGAVATVDWRSRDPGLVVFGREGEKSDQIHIEAGRSGLLIDAGPGAAAGSGCSRHGSFIACGVDPRRLDYVSVAGLSGDDRISASGRLPRRGEILLDGGPGSDKLTGTPGGDVLLAGPDGADRLLGGSGEDALISEAGRDVLHGGSGNDQLVTDDPCDGHLFDGGRGSGDIAGFARSARAQLHARIGGKAIDVRKAHCRGTRILASNEVLEGTRNGDVLIGTPGDDPFIIGGPGSDRVEGRGGDDVLNGEEGRDSLFGGRGTDLLEAKDRRRDRVLDCGPGSDYVKRDQIDPKPKRCRPPKPEPEK